MRRSTYPAGSAVETRIIAKPKPSSAEEKAAGERLSDEAKKILPHGLLFRWAIVCNECAEHYDEGLVDGVTANEISDAFWRINDYCIGRVGRVDERQEACYDCEKEIY